MTTKEFFQLLPRMIYHEDEPIAHPSSVALYKVSELAGKHVKVVLTGEGADELFGGYERYYQTLANIKTDKLLFSILPRSLRSRVFRPLLDALPYKFPFRNKAIRTTVYLEPGSGVDFSGQLLDVLAGTTCETAQQGITGMAWTPTVCTRGTLITSIDRTIRRCWGSCCTQISKPTWLNC